MVAAGLMLLSWFMPWWSCYIVEVMLDNAIVIHPWGLEQNLGPFAGYASSGFEMPVWFAPFMWTYLGICVAALLYGSWLGEKEVKIGKFKFKWPKLLVGGVGLSYIVVVVLAVIVAAIRTGDFYGMHLIGYSYFEVATHVESGVEAGLRFGYWLACGVGPLCIALALLRDRIIGKPKLNT